MDFYQFDTPIGPIALAAQEEAITQLYLPNTPMPRIASRETPLLRLAQEQLLAYAAGSLRDFSLPLAPQGTPFQRRVWAALASIAYGQTASYGDIAREVNCPRGFRAVGMANNKNPIPILIPCHRVVGRDGALVGYAGGLELKQTLLTLERHAT